MIRLQIEQTNKEERLGEYIFHKNLIYVGSNIDADLYLEDPEITPNHIVLELVDNELIAHTGSKVDAIWVQGKITTKFKFLKTGDTIKAANTLFKILDFKQTKIESKRELLNKNTDALIQESSPLLDVIKSIKASK